MSDECGHVISALLCKTCVERDFEAQKELNAFYVDKLNKAEDALLLAQGEMMAAIDKAVAAEAETERLRTALALIASYKGKALLGDGRYDEGANAAFEQVAAIAKDALEAK